MACLSLFLTLLLKLTAQLTVMLGDELLMLE